MPDRLSILFVDDERNVLDGLLRLFRPQRHAWDMSSAISGEAALELMASRHVDVVVSDMRMPGMDGATLLRRIRERHPRAIRIILSGQADREAAMRRFGPGHHFLSKPCDPSRIIAVVERSCALRAFIRDPAVTGWLDPSGLPPALPPTHLRLLEELQSGDPDLSRLTSIIEGDAVISDRLLRVINLPEFGLDRRIASIGDAITSIGLEILRALILGVHLYDGDAKSAADDGESWVQQLWRHSIAVGRLARIILATEHGRPEMCEAAFTAGLLHDCGKALMRRRLGIPPSAAFPGGAASDDAFAAEEAEFGISHDRIGAWLLHEWNLPDSVVEAVAWHARPGVVGDDGLTPLAAVHIANAIFDDRPEHPRQPDAGLIARLGLADRMAGWRATAALVLP